MMHVSLGFMVYNNRTFVLRLRPRSQVVIDHKSQATLLHIRCDCPFLWHATVFFVHTAIMGSAVAKFLSLVIVCIVIVEEGLCREVGRRQSGEPNTSECYYRVVPHINVACIVIHGNV